MDTGSAIEALIVGLQVGTGDDALLAELALAPDEQARVQLELTCLHIVAGHVAIDVAYCEDIELHQRLLSAYRQYWTTHSTAVEFNYLEETDERLPRYRDAALPIGEESGVEAGRVFSRLCGLATLNLTAFGANAFSRRFGRATALLASLDLQDEE